MFHKEPELKLASFLMTTMMMMMMMMITAEVIVKGE
jgi:hypothetical protein